MGNSTHIYLWGPPPTSPLLPHPEGCMLAACLTCLSQSVLHWIVLGVAFYFYQSMGCCAVFALLPHYSHRPQTDVPLRWYTALCRVKFWKIKIKVCAFSCKCTVHAVIIFGAVQQHLWWSTYCTWLYSSYMSAYHHVYKQLKCMYMWNTTCK